MKILIYAVGTHYITKVTVSNDITILSARLTLADRIESRLNSITKSFMTKSGFCEDLRSVLNEISTATKNIIADVDVTLIRNLRLYQTYSISCICSLEEAQILNRLKKQDMLI